MDSSTKTSLKVGTANPIYLNYLGLSIDYHGLIHIFLGKKLFQDRKLKSLKKNHGISQHFNLIRQQLEKSAILRHQSVFQTADLSCDFFSIPVAWLHDHIQQHNGRKVNGLDLSSVCSTATCVEKQFHTWPPCSTLHSERF